MTQRSEQTAPRFQPPDVRRRQILDAVADILLADGYDALTISKAAERAGVGKGTVYLYFETKQDLITALRARVWDRMLVDPAARLERSDLTWTERLDGLVADWVAAEQEQHELYHQLFHDTAGAGDEPFSAARDLLATLLTNGTEAGEFDVTDPELTADFLIHAYAGPCHHRSTDVTAQVQRLFRRTVGAS